MMDSHWYDRSKKVIQAVHDGLSDDASFEERKKAIAAAYPFGERAHHPYKMWLKAQREYLRGYHKSDASVPVGYLSPLERMMRRQAPPTGDTK